MNVALYKKDGHHLRTSKSIYGKMKPSFYSETTNLTYHKLYINDHGIILNKVYNFYSVHYVIKFVSDLQQVGGFLWFPPPIKLTTTI